MDALDELLRRVDAGELGDPLPVLAYIAGQSVEIDDQDLNGARRRALLLVAAGGDPHRELGVDDRAVKALAADLLVTVTPGKEVVLGEGSLRPGQHASLMGADGPGKAEIAVEELARVHVFCDDWEQGGTNRTSARGRIYADDWEQASHNGDLVHAVEAGVLTRDDVSQLGDVLMATANGRQSDRDITIFDSTGLAIQDLAIALAALERANEFDLPMIDL